MQPARHRPGTSRRQLGAWGALACAVVVSAVLLSVATTTTRDSRRAVGNGIGNYTAVSTTRDDRLAAGAWVALAGGLVAWASILGRSSSPTRRVPAAVAAAGIAATGWWLVIAPLASGDGFSDSERYASVGAVVDALRAEGIPCAEVVDALPAETDGLFEERAACRQPTAAAIRDGHDDVIIEMFASDSERTRWTESVDHDDVFAVIGPEWLTTCEFQATCARIQAAIGGRNY